MSFSEGRMAIWGGVPWRLRGMAMCLAEFSMPISVSSWKWYGMHKGDPWPRAGQSIPEGANAPVLGGRAEEGGYLLFEGSTEGHGFQGAQGLGEKSGTTKQSWHILLYAWMLPGSSTVQRLIVAEFGLYACQRQSS